MPTSLLLSFAADHPVTAFFLSWPLLLLLLGVSWSAATLMTNAMNACVALIAQLTSFVMVLARGYPKSWEKGKDGEDGEGKPLAS